MRILTNELRKPPPGGDWFWLQNDALDIVAMCGPMAFVVYAALASHADGKGECYPSVGSLAKRFGSQRKYIRQAIKALVTAGLVTVQPRRTSKKVQTSHLYKLTERLSTPQNGMGSKTTPGVGSNTTLGVGSNWHHEQDPVLTRQDGTLFFPEILNTDRFREAWQKWLAYRQERELSGYKSIGLKSLFKRLEGLGEARAIAAIEFSIAQNWKGIYEEHSNGKTNGKPQSTYKTLVPPAARCRRQP